MKTVISTIIERHSPRAFSDKIVEKNELDLIFEAARWAPSAYNAQPWRFIVGMKNDNSSVYEKIFTTLVDFNKMWAGTAPVLILIVANTINDKGEKNSHAWYDAGQAVANISAQATAMGMVLHQMSGFDPAAAKTAFSMPDGMEPIAVMALGYNGKLSDVPEMIQNMEINKIRERKPLSEIVTFDKF